jgi:hypothetical protein
MWITQLWETPKVYAIQTAVPPTGFPAGPYVKNEALGSLVIRSKAKVALLSIRWVSQRLVAI